MDKFYCNSIWENIKGIYGRKKGRWKEALELKKVYNHYLDKIKDIMISTKIKVEEVFGDVKSKDSISIEQITKRDNFSAKITWI